MIPGKQITLSLEDDFLNFSSLSTPENDELDAKVCEMDYGIYHPASVDTILHPLATLAMADGTFLTTPLERQLIENEEKAQRTIARSARKAEVQSAGTVTRTLKTALIDAEELFDSTVTDVKSSFNKQSTKTKDFNKLLLPNKEDLHQSFSCSMLTGDTIADGTVYITTHYLVFVGHKRAKPLPEFGAGPGRKVTAIRITVPLRSIASLHRAQSKLPERGHGLSGLIPTSLKSNNIPTFVCTGKGKEKDADGVMIYTHGYKLHIIYNLVSGLSSHYNDFLAVLNHGWRLLSTAHNLKQPGLRLDSSEPIVAKAE